MSRLRFFLVAGVCAVFWGLLGAALGACARHPLGGLICGLLLGSVYAAACSYAAPKFPGDAWDAKLLENIHAPNLYEMLHALCERTGQALPTLYFCPRSEPNAFAVAGRDGETSVVVTAGLTRSLEKDEVQAVMALMMARLATDAMPVWTLAATLAGVPVAAGLKWQALPGVAIFGTFWLALTARPAAALVRLAYDEKIVLAADFHAAHLTETAGALARALAKIEAEIGGSGGGNPATALLFAVPPLHSVSAGAPAWRRGLAAFPFQSPDAAARAARFAEVVPPPPNSYGTKPDKEYSIFDITRES